ncbi:putative iron-sulfur cluster assembly 2 like mitochondrial [Erysiphe necator]|uniref:Putative iron-sulfur cluster assembly 2 like mitochondrial n=1 Tax=Uncinula necator TaxID=52586 RepID=A0A0B1PCL0_UNCNE|nr:putative iron-sulfur cluster assembly 2 like mitochondrial [Erysiphe necator]
MAAQKCCFRLKNIYPLRIFLQTELFRRNGFLTPLNFDFLLSTTSKITHTQYLVARNSNSYRNSLRCYSASSKRPKTTAILNPLKDEDGTDMKIEITPRASNRLKEIMSQDSNPNLALRIKVVNGGCHGFQYLMSLTTLPSDINSTVAQTDDNQYHSVKNLISDDSDNNGQATLCDDDIVFAANDGTGAKVVINASSLEVLKGSKIDYTMELIGSQFKIVDNPLATSSCGCGTSFDIK